MVRVIYVVAVLGIALLFAGCGGSASDQPSTKTAAESTTKAAESTTKAAEGAKAAAEGNAKSAARPRHSQKPQPGGRKVPHISLSLAGYPDAESAGVFIAEQRGYFADEGLDVSVLTPVSSDSVARYVNEGVDDVGISHQPQVVMARQEGMPLVAIGSLVRRPTMAMIWLKKSKIHDIADLKGKTIAIDGLPFEESFLREILARAGLKLRDVKLKRAGYQTVPALTSGRADAVFGGSWNVEALELRSRGLKPVVIPVQKLGIPSYEELVVITRRDRLARDPEWIGPLMAALAHGTAVALKNPEAAAKAVAFARTKHEPFEQRRPKPTGAEVKATLPLLSRTGRMSPARAADLIGWMRRQGLIPRKLPPASLLTNRYVKSSP